MKIKNGFKLRNVAGEQIVSGESIAQINFNKLISLNESAAYLWSEVEGREFSVEQLAELLMSRYDISAERASADALSISKSWADVGLTE